MFYSVSEWDPSVRYIVFALCNVFVVLWARCIITRAKAGIPRLCLSIPVHFACAFMSILFDFQLTKDHGTAMFICTNYLWLAVSKVSLMGL